MVSISQLYVVHLSSGVPSFPHYLVAKLHLNHRKASPCVFNFSFFLSSFYYRSSSWRLYMVVRQGFFSFFNCSSRFLLKLRSAKLYSKNKHGAQHMFCFEEFKHSSSCILKCNSFISHLLRWCYVIVDNFPFVFHDSQVFKSDIS